MNTELTVSEAARQMGVSPERVRRLCKRGALPGAHKDSTTGTWRIPTTAIAAYTASSPHPVSQSTPQHQPGPGFWSRIRLFITPTRAIISLISAILIFIFAMVSGIADYSQFQERMVLWGLTPIEEAKKDEVLIVISKFYRTEGVIDTAPDMEIQKRIQDKAKEAGLDNVRVVVDPRSFMPDEIEKAKKLGNRYKANVIIWGMDTGLRVTVNFLNIKNPEFDSSQVRN